MRRHPQVFSSFYVSMVRIGEMTGALDGVRVLDFGQYVAGPLTAMLLSDQGADVIRIERPGGPSWDTPANVIWNRGKRSIALDLHVEADAAVATIEQTYDAERLKALIANDGRNA